jgi:hypothetical protein
MAKRTRILRRLGKAAYAIALMVLGAQMLAQYLIHTEADLADKLRSIESALQIAFLVFAIASASLDPRDTAGDLKEPSPRYAGVAVVVVTGATASIAVARSSYLYALLIAAVTIAAAAIVWRFASTHANQIGEARFPSPAIAE